MLALTGFEIVAKVDESVNSIVYQGIRNSDNLPVILKVLKKEYPTPDEIRRYKQEYEIISRLSIDGVVRGYDLRKHENAPVIILEDFGGVSLKKVLASRTFSLAESLQIAIKITSCLGELHQQNVIHKDINPANIVLNLETGIIKLIDFDISTVLTRETPTIKNPNFLEGTLAYISPEQTGRMNRSLDYHTDYYSLGVTFYELLTGQLPCYANDAIALVHCHIAKQPVPPCELNKEIPKPVSDIVMKLLAKTAEERYQSAYGLKADLEECLTQLERNGKIREFAIGRKDISDKFQIPQKIYGREEQINNLIETFERVIQGSSEIMLVSGYSGIGKTSLVQEIYKPITKRKGYFIAGKFDQFQRNIPYSAIVSAFSDLVRQLLTESEAQLGGWREKLKAALGVNGQVIIDLIPEVELIIGKQSPVVKLPPTEAQNRLNLVFQNFINVFAKVEHPLVIFIDDLQWADTASLKLLELLMATTTAGLFIIGACRDNEVNAAHPLILTLDEIQKTGALVNHIFLEPLDLANVNLLISDTLHCTPSSSLTLAELVLERTKGNPFFINEFLKSLYAEKLIEFDYQQGNWQWSIERIAAQGFTDNVVELLADKIQKLSPNTQQALQLAACVGNQFDLHTLAIVYEKSPKQTAADLWEAVAEGLVIPLGNVGDVQFTFSESFDDELPITDYPLPEYKFAHDRIQQAEYSLIPPSSKQAVHWRIGKLLLQKANGSTLEENIFDIVNQLNIGINLITTESEKEQLANFNLIAGQKAKAATAYEAAVKYLNRGLQLLNEDSWQTHYSLTLSLSVEAVEAEFLSANFDRAAELTEIVLAKAQTLLDRVKICELKMQFEIAQNKMLKAIDTGVKALRLLGISLSTSSNTQPTFPKLPQLEELETLPVMTAPEDLAAMRILIAIMPAAYQAKPEIMLVVILTMIQLCLDRGHSALAPYPYALYGMILCAAMGDIEGGYHAGQLGLRLLEQFNAKEFQAKVYTTFNPFIRPWKEHARETLAPFIKGLQSGLETGDLEYGSYCAMNYCTYLFLVGEQLESVEEKQVKYINILLQLKREVAIAYAKIWGQLVQSLVGNSSDKYILTGKYFDESVRLPELKTANNGMLLFAVYLSKLILLYTLKNRAQALENAFLAAEQLGCVMGFMTVATHNFYYSLSLLAMYGEVDANEQEKYLALVESNQEKMQLWAYHCPANYQHKYDLIEAQKARVLGKVLEAMELYDRAIAGAKEQEYTQEEALANELAAEFYLVQGRTQVAKTYMTEAYYRYIRWGAIAKVKDLDERYPELISQLRAKDPTVSRMTTTSSTSGKNSGAELDLATIMKASLAISSEIVLDKLLASLMKILLENAGATNGFLILPKDGQLLIEASLTVDSKKVTVLQSLPIDFSRNLPTTVINYVERTCSSVLLRDAAREGAFTTDPYIMSNKLKSVLCTPIINQGKLIAILYLENNLAEGVFTSERVEILKLLSSQAAISLENALFYANLEQKVEERTRELKAKEASLAEAQKLAHLGSWELNLVTQEAPWSEEMFRIHGLNPNQGKPDTWQYFQLIHPNDRNFVEKQVERIINTGESYEIEYRLLGTDGCVRYIFAKTQANLNESGEVIKIFGTVLDITERKLVEIALQESEAQLKQTLQELKRTQSQLIQTEKMSSLGQVVAGVAHEINNPVSFIYSNITPASEYIQYLLKLIRLYQQTYPYPTDEILDNTEEIDLEFVVEDLQKLMGSMKNGAERISSIVLSLRNFSRLDEAEMKAVDIHEGIDSTLLILQHRLHQKDESFEVEVIKEYGKLPLINCYASQMNQVFMNILNNAIDALKEGENKNPQICIRTEVSDSHYVKITIADNGVGMSEDVVSKIFDPFFTTKPVGSGTGLGLSVCYQIVVEKHGGKLSCISSPGEGTQLEIVLPYALRDRASD